MPSITIDKYPQLSALCWSRTMRTVEEADALQLYESGWRFIEKDRLTSSEQVLINRLADSYGNGVFNLKVEPDHEGVPGGIYVKHDHDILARRTILDRKT